jgi:hypothetical protein
MKTAYLDVPSWFGEYIYIYMKHQSSAAELKHLGLAPRPGHLTTSNPGTQAISSWA